MLWYKYQQNAVLTGLASSVRCTQSVRSLGVCYTGLPMPWTAWWCAHALERGMAVVERDVRTPRIANWWRSLLACGLVRLLPFQGWVMAAESSWSRRMLGGSVISRWIGVPLPSRTNLWYLYHKIMILITTDPLLMVKSCLLSLDYDIYTIAVPRSSRQFSRASSQRAQSSFWWSLRLAHEACRSMSADTGCTARGHAELSPHSTVTVALGYCAGLHAKGLGHWTGSEQPYTTQDLSAHECTPHPAWIAGHASSLRPNSVKGSCTCQLWYLIMVF